VARVAQNQERLDTLRAQRDRLEDAQGTTAIIPTDVNTQLDSVNKQIDQLQQSLAKDQAALTPSE
jgi:hypothetical protein